MVFSVSLSVKALMGIGSSASLVTVTVQVADRLLLDTGTAVTVTVPGFMPVISPSCTRTTCIFDELHMTSCVVAFSGVRIAVSCAVSFVRTVTDCWSMAIDSTCTKGICT